MAGITKTTIAILAVLLLVVSVVASYAALNRATVSIPVSIGTDSQNAQVGFSVVDSSRPKVIPVEPFVLPGGQASVNIVR